MTNVYERIAQNMLERQQRRPQAATSVDVYDRLAERRTRDIEQITARKEADAAFNVQRKRRAYDPNFRTFDPDEWLTALDGDTLVHKTERDEQGRPLTMRLGLPGGHSFDTWETRKRRPDGTFTDPYANDEQRAHFHREAYARQFNVDPDDVSNEDLYDAGNAQTQSLKDNIESLRGQPYYMDRKADKYGRALGKFDDPYAFDTISKGSHAGFFSSFNSARYVQEFNKDPSKILEPQERAWYQNILGTDTIANIGLGAAEMALGLKTFERVAENIVLGREITEEDIQNHQNIKDLIEKFAEHLLTPEAFHDRKRDRHLQEVIQNPLWQKRYTELNDKGMPKVLSWVIATGADWGDALERLVQQPERIADKAAQSIMYTYGIGVVGRKTAEKATKELTRQIIPKLVDRAIKRPITSQKTADEMMKQILKTNARVIRPAVDRIVTRTGIAAVGLTEGAMNAADAFAQIATLTPEQLESSEKYQNLIKRGMSPEDARINLAKDVFKKVFVVNTAVAGLASKLTGAGKWESNLLRNFQEKTDAGIIRRIGRNIKAGGVAGGREFLEESAQSGGGELIRQVFSHPITGEDIGPGVGAITAEGGLIGLATGFSLSQVRALKGAAGKGAKKGMEALSRTNRTKLQQAADVYLTENNTKAAVAEVTSNLNAFGYFEKADEYIDRYLNRAKELENKNLIGPRLVPELRVFHAAFKQKLEVMKEKQPELWEEKKAELQAKEKQYEKDIGRYVAQYNIALKITAENLKIDVEEGVLDDETIFNTPEMKGALKEAQDNIPSFKYETDHKELGRFLSSARAASEAVKAVQDQVSQAEPSTLTQGTGKHIDQVREEKLGYGSHVVGNMTLYGLAAIEQQYHDAIMAGDEEAYRLADFQLTRLQASQAPKLMALREMYRAIEAVRGTKRKATILEIQDQVNEKYGTNIHWVERVHGTSSGTPGLFREVALEQKGIAEVRRTQAELALASGMDNKLIQTGASTPNQEVDLNELLGDIPSESPEVETVIDAETQAETAVEAPAETKVEAPEQGPGAAPAPGHREEASPTEPIPSREPKGATAVQEPGRADAQQGASEDSREGIRGITPTVREAREQRNQTAAAFSKALKAFAKKYDYTEEELLEIEDINPNAFPLEERADATALAELAVAQAEALSAYSRALLKRTPEQDKEIVQFVQDYEDALAMDDEERNLLAIKLGIPHVKGDGPKRLSRKIQRALRDQREVEAIERAASDSEERLHTQVEPEPAVAENATPIPAEPAELTDDEINAQLAEAAANEEDFDEQEAIRQAQEEEFASEGEASVGVEDETPVESVTEPSTKTEGETAPTEATEASVEESAKAALRAAGFIFVDRNDAPGIEMIRRVASKRLREGNPEDTAAALAYIVYGEMGLASRDTQMLANLTAAIEDWIRTGKTPAQVSKTVWARVLEVLDRLVAFFKSNHYAAMEKRLEQELERVLADPNSFTFVPSEGRSKLNFQLLIDNNPGVAHILTIFQKAGIVAHLTGSMAYVDQTAIYRNADKPVHDVDLLYYSEEDVTRSLKLLEEEFGQGQKMYGFKPKGDASTKEVLGYVYPSQVGHKIVDYKSGFTKKGGAWRAWRVVDENGKEVGTFKMVPQKDGTMKDVSTGHPGIAVDFMLVNETGRTPISQTYTDPNSGEEVTIEVSSFIDGFVAKLQMLRAKDIKDLIAATPQANEVEEVEATLLEAAETLALVDEEQRELPSQVVNRLKLASNFASDLLVKHIGPLVGVLAKVDNDQFWKRENKDKITKLDRTRASVIAKFKELGLPTQLLQVASSKNSKVTNLLAAANQVFSSFKDERVLDAFYNIADTTEEEEEAFDNIVEFVNNFTEALRDVHLGMINDNSHINSSLKHFSIGENKEGLIKPLQRYLFQFLLSEDGSLNSSHADMMALELGKWMAAMGSSTLNREDWDVNRQLGLPKDTEIGPVTEAKYRNGVPLRSVAQQLGRGFLDQANIQVDREDDVAPDFEERLALSIGLMILSAGTDQWIEIKPVDITRSREELHELSDAQARDAIEKEAVEGNLLTVHVKQVKPEPIPEEEEDTGEDTRAEDDKNLHLREAAKNVQLRLDFKNAKRILTDFFNVTPQYRRPLDSPPEDGPSRVQRMLGRVPKKLRAFLKNSSSNAVAPIAQQLDEFHRWEGNHGLFLKYIMGQVDEKTIETTISTNRTRSVRSKNARNIRSLEYVTDRLRDYGTRPMYFAYNVISTHRSQMDSNELNPQMDKLHRALFGMDSWEVLMTTEDPTSLFTNGMVEVKSPEQIAMMEFKLSLALAFDVGEEAGDGVDTMFWKDSIAELEKKLEDPIVRAALDVMKMSAKIHLTDGKYNEAQMTTIGEAVQYLNSSEPAHAWAGLKAWADFEKARDAGKKTVRINLPMEADGKTNGFASLLMQIVPNDPDEILRLMPLYSGVGQFFKQSKFENYPQFNQDGGKDNYRNTVDATDQYILNMIKRRGIPDLENSPFIQTKAQKEELKRLAERAKDRNDSDLWEERKRRKAQIASQVKTIQENYAAEIKAQGFVELVRKFAKGPLTQIAYSAGMSAIRRGVKKSAEKQFWEELAAAGADQITDQMSEEEKADVTEVAIAQVLQRFLTVAYAVENADPAVKDKKSAPTIQEVAQHFNFKQFRNHKDMVHWRRTVDSSESKRMEGRRGEMVPRTPDFTIPQADIERFLIGMDVIYGHALQAALEDKRRHIKPFTDLLNDAVYAMNLVFTEKYKELLQQLEEDTGKEPQEVDRRRVLNRMIKDGLVPMINTPLSETQMDGLELTNYGQVSLESSEDPRAFFNDDFQIQNRGIRKDGSAYKPKTQSTIRAKNKVIDPNMDVGVAAIAKAIHSSDGAVNGSMMGDYSILNLFDALYGNFTEMREMTEESNKRFYETHRDWDMGQEFSKALQKFVLLLDPSDSRLSAAAKADILDRFKKQRFDFARNDSVRAHISSQSPLMHWEQWFDQFLLAVDQNTKGRELLYRDFLAYSNQFAGERTQYKIPTDDKLETGSDERLIQGAQWTTGLIDVLKHGLNNAGTASKLQAQRAIEKALVEGGEERILVADEDGKGTHWETIPAVNAAFNEYMQTAPLAEDVIDVLFAVLRTRMSVEDAERLRNTVNIIRPTLSWKKEGVWKQVYILPGTPEEMGLGTDRNDNARYYRDSGVIKLRTNAKDPFSDLLHELVHAANTRQLEAMNEENAPELIELVREAKQFEKTHKDAPPTSPEKKTADSIHGIIWQKTPKDEDPDKFREDKLVRIATEYIAHINSELTWTGKRARYSFQKTSTVTGAAKLLSNSMTPDPGSRIYYSNSEEVNPALFEQQTGEKLTRDSMMQVFYKLRQYDTGLDNETQTLFHNILESFIAPGLDSIDYLIYKIAENPDAMQNVGRLLREDGQNTIQLQATANNFYSNPMDMSMQETAIHEIAHAIFEFALVGLDENHPGKASIQKAARALFEHTLIQLESRWGNDVWKAFLPDPNNYTPIEEDRARARYVHIFEHMDSAEFMAYGVSNPQFMRILSDLDNLPPRPLWQGNIISFFAALWKRVLHVLRGEIFAHEPKNMNQALHKLAAKIVHINNLERRQVKKYMEKGWIGSGIDGLSEKAILKIAELTNAKLRQAAEEASLTGNELNAKMKHLNKVAGTLVALKSAGASLVIADLTKFREAYEEAVGKQDHWLPEMMTELLPIAERNRSWVDFLLYSEKRVDMTRQQTFEHSRSLLKSLYEDYEKFDVPQREALTQVLANTDLQVLLRGDNPFTLPEILRLITDPDAREFHINALLAELNQLDVAHYVNTFDIQSKGLANLMTHGKNLARMQQKNVHNIVDQRHLPAALHRPRQNRDRLIVVLDRLTTIRALHNTPTPVLDRAGQILTREQDRGTVDNGFNGTLGILHAFYDQSLEKNFKGNPILMRKGHVSQIFDEEIHMTIKPYTDEESLEKLKVEMEALQFTFMETLPRDDAIDPNRVNLAAFKTNRGIATYSKSGMSLTTEQKAGIGIVENLFTSIEGEASRITAAKGQAMLAGAIHKGFRAAEQQFLGIAPATGVKLVPVYNEEGEVKDMTYNMTQESRKKHLKQREYLDEVLPHMLAGVQDKVNSKTVNERGIELLHKEYIAHLNNPESTARFVEIGRYTNPEGREMWALLPKATQIAAAEAFGDDIIYVRDDAVNIIFGFRKMSVANNKFLSKHAPIARAIEKIWQEIIQWERFRIAVLNPVVVIGNFISNVMLLLMQRIPPEYIIRGIYQAAIGMRMYQKDVRERNELAILIDKRIALGQNVHKLQVRLAQLKQAIAVNPVHEIVQEGLFTSIVEEFGVDENSSRRKITTKVVDKIGGITGTRTGVKFFQELFMVPGSTFGQAALTATQYGDFVGRYVQYNWNTKIKKRDKREAIHAALDNFIYYNIPQNRILQAMNDNGLLMFTKFFFRIQRVIYRIFKENPGQATAYMGMQEMLFNSNVMEENISNYAFMHNLTGKFKFFPWDHFNNFDMVTPMSLKWLDIFWPG